MTDFNVLEVGHSLPTRVQIVIAIVFHVVVAIAVWHAGRHCVAYCAENNLALTLPTQVALRFARSEGLLRIAPLVVACLLLASARYRPEWVRWVFTSSIALGLVLLGVALLGLAIPFQYP